MLGHKFFKLLKEDLLVLEGQYLLFILDVYYFFIDGPDPI